MLTKEQIQFIDKYLEDQGIYYIDIRHEMTDHIATELEQKADDFRENFLAYRAFNQKNMLKQKNMLYKLSIYKSIKYMLKITRRPVNMIIIISTYLICNYIISIYAANSISYLSYALSLFPLPFAILNKYTEKSSIPKNILHGLSLLLFIGSLLLYVIDFIVDNTIITAITARYISSAFISIMPVCLLSVIKYKSHNYKLN